MRKNEQKSGKMAVPESAYIHYLRKDLPECPVYNSAHRGSLDYLSAHNTDLSGLEKHYNGELPYTYCFVEIFLVSSLRFRQRIR